MFSKAFGKRVTGSFFIDHLARHGMHTCDYLLAVDVEMEPLPGFSMASWEEGYGDFHATIDSKTLRLIPWLPATALVLADLDWEEGSPVVQSPRAILRRQIERARDAGFVPMMGSELEFYLFVETHDELSRRDFDQPRPSSEYITDYHILQTSRDEPVIREIRNGNICTFTSQGERNPT